MKELIRAQHISKASKYQQIIRESVEFRKEDIEACDDDDLRSSLNQSYEHLKCQVIGILQKKIDKKNYKKTIRSCKQVIEEASEDWSIGSSYKPLRMTIKKIKKQMKFN